MSDSLDDFVEHEIVVDDLVSDSLADLVEYEIVGALTVENFAVVEMVENFCMVDIYRPELKVPAAAD